MTMTATFPAAREEKAEVAFPWWAGKFIVACLNKWLNHWLTKLSVLLFAVCGWLLTSSNRRHFLKPNPPVWSILYDSNN